MPISGGEQCKTMPDGVLSPFKLCSSIYLPENTITQSPPRPPPATLHPPLGSNRKCGVRPSLPSVDKLIFHTNIQQDINKDQLLFMATVCFLASWGGGVGGASKPKPILCIMGEPAAPLRSAYQQSGPESLDHPARFCSEVSTLSTEIRVTEVRNSFYR